MQSPMFDPAGAGQQLGDPRRLILDWQRPMYDLACRMLGNEADAADATQEIFLTVLRQLPRYDRRRPFRPWLYRLATNVIRNGIRNSRLRRERETQAAMNAQHRSEGDPLERLELERLVHGQVAKLPEALRSLILLHYYHGLTQEEAAQALSIPRTTARSRIQKALETLRRGLAASGSLAVAVDVESLMKTSAPIPVPPQVTASLMAIAADAGATAAVTTGITVGGILMTKQVIAGAVLVGLVCLAAGYLAGRTTLRADGEPARRLAGPAEPALSAAARAKIERLEAEYARALERVKQLEADRTLAARAAEASGRISGAESSSAEPAASSSGPAAAGEDRDASSPIDWSRFAKLFAENADKLGGALADENALAPEDRAKMYELAAEFMKIAQQAKDVSTNPFFDPAILPDYIEALYGESLGLTPSQRAELDRLTRALLDRELAQVDPRTALPVEAYQARQRILAEIADSLAARLAPEQRERWDSVNPAASTLLQGDRGISRIGVSPGENRSSSENGVFEQWNRSYRFSEDQEPFVRGLLRGYVAEAQHLLRHYGQFAATPTPLGHADERRLYEDFARLQARMEREFQHLLTPEQREAMRHRPPILLRFEYGDNLTTELRNGMGF